MVSMMRDDGNIMLSAKLLPAFGNQCEGFYRRPERLAGRRSDLGIRSCMSQGKQVRERRFGSVVYIV